MRPPALASFGASNFKSFDSLQEVPVRPITLLFGRNNSGKSAMLRALVHGAAMSRAFGSIPDSPYLGGTTDLSQGALSEATADVGSYPVYLHSPELPEAVFSYAVSVDPRGRSSDLMLGIVGELGLDVVFAFDEQDESEPTPGRPLLRTSSTLRLDGEPILVDGKINPSSRVVTRILEWAVGDAPANRIGPEAASVLARILEYLRFDVEVPGEFPPRMAYHPLLHARWREALLSGRPLDSIEDSRPRALMDLMQERADRRLTPEETVELAETADRIGVRLATLYAVVRETVFECLGKASYLGPLRAVPDSVWTMSGPSTHGEPWWATLAAEEPIRNQVNTWLARILGSDDPVALHVEWNGSGVPLGEADVPRLARALLAAAQDLLVRGMELAVGETSSFVATWELTPEYLAEQWARAIVRSAKDRTYAKVLLAARSVPRLLTPAQVGLGLSQVIPVVASAVASQHQLLLVEQPELHLHPAMQAELADLFVESAVGTKQNTWIIETHSEHLLLRLIRRIRETVADRLPEGHPKLTAEDVSICFIEKEEGVSRVFPIPLDENGLLTRPWPGGFFEEGFREVMAW